MFEVPFAASRLELDLELSGFVAALAPASGINIPVRYRKCSYPDVQHGHVTTFIQTFTSQLFILYFSPQSLR